MIRTLLALLAAFGLLALFIHSCSGPRPQVVSARMEGQVAVATLRNEGFGEGQVDVEFIVQGRSGPPRIHNERATLAPREVARVEWRVDGARGDERVQVEVDYPPR